MKYLLSIHWSLKAEYIKDHQAQLLVMGDDWAGRFDQFKHLCDVVSFKANTINLNN